MSFEQLGEPVEVAETRTRGQLPRLLLALLGIGLVIGALAAVGSLLLGSFAQTEAGLCRLTWAPCSELSVTSVEQLSGVELPEGTRVVSGYAQELGTLYEFRAEVVLPEGGLVTMSSSYGEAEPFDTDLGAPRFWQRPIVDGEGRDTAVVGTGADGSTVILFDAKYATRP